MYETEDMTKIIVPKSVFIRVVKPTCLGTVTVGTRRVSDHSKQFCRRSRALQQSK
jgi:hypothetical protein